MQVFVSYLFLSSLVGAYSDYILYKLFKVSTDTSLRIGLTVFFILTILPFVMAVNHESHIS